MITNNRGAPYGWVQDGRYRATWAVLIRFFMVLSVGSTTGAERVPVNKDGTPMQEPTSTALPYVALAIKWITCTFLYGFPLRSAAHGVLLCLPSLGGLRKGAPPWK